MTWESVKTTGIVHATTIAIVLLNMISGLILSILADKTEFKTMTQKSWVTMIGQFMLTYFLTGCAVMILYAAELRVFVPFADKTEYHYLNINREWYNDVGNVTLTTIVVNAFTSIFIWMFKILYFNACIWWDRRSIKMAYRTQQTTMDGYINLRSGEQFGLDSSYSALMATVFTCIMFGGILPLFYFAGFIILLIQYMLDKLLICYYNTKPLSYSNKLGEAVIGILPGAVIMNIILSVIAMTHKTLISDLELFNIAGFSITIPVVLLIVFAILAIILDIKVVRRLIRRNVNVVQEKLQPYTVSLSKKQVYDILSELDYQKIKVFYELLLIFLKGIDKGNDGLYEKLQQRMQQNDDNAKIQKILRGIPNYGNFRDKDKYKKIF